MSSDPMPPYDRRAASRILADLARPGLLGPTTSATTAGSSARARPGLLDTARATAAAPITYTATAMRTEPNSHLTLSQRLYLERYMRPCRPDQVTGATHRITWTDSDGIPNTGHVRAGGLGPIVPIAMRETVLALWHSLAEDTALQDRIAALGAGDRAVLAGTTTDGDPNDIFRVGIEATGRALAQHALLSGSTPYRSPAEFACGMRDSGIFAAVATRWYWELQASSYRRGMIPVAFAVQPDGTVRYTTETIATLRAMKDATIADAHAVMRRATTAEGLPVAAAIEKYHDELDLISRQYAMLAPGSRPACLAAMPHQGDGGHYTLLPVVVDRFVAVFAAITGTLTVAGSPGGDDSDGGALTADDHVFYVPDMNCKHCVRTIGGVLESMRITVGEIDLIGKRVVAEFRSPRNRHRAFEALRDSGYNPTVLPPAPRRGTAATLPPTAAVHTRLPETTR
ncbi:heavy-metal-associated domain-containing protein [Nocardia sp. alder85J]|uniref:heavy-metal-associated domain-containing protein n=1 Tax=Nocardia sp. alder85J TaxID=2862949 RepID=UPI001CD456E2|nr:heavy-metal-associated domain-containing protein [Nocardia sp. alder85J]MCX4091674.1 heavy-metal-associated domain-containing protein [Nocardia sp. alder85J]